jgi:hypothetical protein
MLILLTRIIIRDSTKTGIIVTFFLMLFFSYGNIIALIETRPVIEPLINKQLSFIFLARHKLLTSLWIILYVSGVFFTIKTKRDLRNISKILSVVICSFLVMSLFQIGIYKFSNRGMGRATVKINYGHSETTKLTRPDTLRDIYFIVLDGYASSRILTDVYDFSNQSFTDILTDRGFYVAAESSSNYAHTIPSLASSLNMDYIQHLINRVGVKSMDQAYQLIHDNKVMNILRSIGYRFINYPSGSFPSNYNKFALNIKCGGLNEFTMVLIQSTMLRPLGELPFIDFLPYVSTRQRILCTFSSLASLHTINEPKFVFAHIISPHPPYVFGADGEKLPKAVMKMTGDIWGEKEDYVNQLMYVNKQIEIIIDEILNNSRIPPIIIIQADHGPAATIYDSDNNGWDNPSITGLNERMRILNAYYLPAGGDSILYDFITPVNNFRIVFNYYFGTNQSLLEDEIYYSPLDQTYNFSNVTEKIKNY